MAGDYGIVLTPRTGKHSPTLNGNRSRTASRRAGGREALNVCEHPSVPGSSYFLTLWVAALPMIVGPIVGGFILAGFGLATVYGAAATGQLAALLVMLSLDRQPADPDRADRLGFSAIRNGVAYMRPRRVLKGLLWIDVIAMTFGMRRALFPILAVEQFHRGPEAVGLLMAAIPAGALAVILTAGWLDPVHRQGLRFVTAAVVWGAAVALFGLSGPGLWLALALLAIAGGADIVAAILRASIIQYEVPASSAAASGASTSLC